MSSSSSLPGGDSDEVAAAKARLIAVSEKNIDPTTVMGMYKDWAAQYDKDLDLTNFHPESIACRKTVEYMSELKDKRLLDAGAGTGRLGAAIKKEGFTNVDALDGSQEMLDVAKGKDIYKNYICSMMGAKYVLPIEDNTYDGVTMTGAQVPGHVGGDCYDELIRITKPGGLVMFTFNERYLGDPAFQADIEGKAYALAKAGGKWQLVKRDVSPNYQGNWGEANNNGITFVFRVL